jgi:FixJ family two-component response regulator
MAKNASPIVYLVDDNLGTREFLCVLVKSHNLQVEAFDSALSFLENCQLAQRKCRQEHQGNVYPPECPMRLSGCLVLDIQMPVMTGLELQQELIKHHFDLPIIFLSGHADVSSSTQAFKAGAFDFFEKPFDNDLLFKRIQEAIIFDSSVYEQRCLKCKMQYSYQTLTQREKDVFCLIVKGYSNKEIALLLQISPRTIESHRAHLMEKMKAENLTDLIRMAINYDLLQSESKELLSNNGKNMHIFIDKT